jgi:hypothetical protein
MQLYVQRNLKQITFYLSWALLLAISVFRYKVWQLFNKHKYCSEDQLLAYAQAALKPENWLALGVLIFTIIGLVRLYSLMYNRLLWFSHYGRFVAVGVAFLALWLLSWSCNGI